jgi:hypothetical protein
MNEKELRQSALAVCPWPHQALISTSTPLGRSSLLNASTVREDEV